MEPMLQFAMLAAATILAAAVAVGLNWFFLQATFRLIEPANTGHARVAASRPVRVPSELVQGTQAIMRQFRAHR